METKSVTQFNQWLKVAFDFVNTRLNFVIKGEISSLNVHYSGHVYATLKENNDTVKIIIWKSLYQKKNFKLEIGQNIEVKGKLNYYEPTSAISLVINDFNFVDTNGHLKQKMAELEAKYQSLGYFDISLKKQMPKQIKTVAIVTAKTGDAINDIVKTFNRRNNTIKLVLYPCLVQGNQAKTQISQQIRKINLQTKYHFDAIIVGRGGGSFEDLFAFNEAEVIEAIHESNIFVISAVGHEADVLLSDKVADIRASTPTAAAEMLSQKTLKDFANEIEYLTNFINITYANKINMLNQKLQTYLFEEKLGNQIKLLEKSINFEVNNISTLINNKQNILSNYDFKPVLNVKFKLLQQKVDFIYNVNLITNKIEYYQNLINFESSDKIVQNKLNYHHNQLLNLDENITNLGPNTILKRGYTLIKNKDGHIIKNAQDITSEFEIMFNDGVVNAKKV